MCCGVSTFDATPATMHGEEGGCAFQTTRTVISRTIVIVELQVSEFQGTRHVSTSDRREGLRSLRRMTRIGHPTFQGTSRRVPTALSLSPYIFFCYIHKKQYWRAMPERQGYGRSVATTPQRRRVSSADMSHSPHSARALACPTIPPWERIQNKKHSVSPFSFFLSLHSFFRFFYVAIFILKKVLAVCRFFFLESVWLLCH